MAKNTNKQKTLIHPPCDFNEMKNNNNNEKKMMKQIPYIATKRIKQIKQH